MGRMLNGTALRNFRIDPDLWRDFGKAAKPDRSAVLRAFIAWYLRRPGSKLPKRAPEEPT